MTVDLLPTGAFVRRPLLWLDLISKNRATISYSPSFGYDLSTRRGATQVPADLDLSSWRRAGIGGDMIRPEVLNRFAEAFEPSGFDRKAFIPSYGMAEVCSPSPLPARHGRAHRCVDRKAGRNPARGAGQTPPTSSGARFVLRPRAAGPPRVRPIWCWPIASRTFSCGPQHHAATTVSPKPAGGPVDSWLDTGDPVTCWRQNRRRGAPRT
jgi:fatty-acyl-CoA synthase